MTQNCNVCVTPGDVVRASMLALLDTLRIVFQIPLDLLRFVWILGLFLISGSLKVCWKLIAFSFVILRALIKEILRTETKEEAKARWERGAPERRRKFVAWLKSLWRGVIRFVVFIGKCFRFLWKSCLFLIYLLSFCSDRLEGLAGGLSPIADDADADVDEYAEDDSEVYEEGDYDDSPAEDDSEVYEERDYDDSPAEDDSEVYEEGDYDDSPAEDDTAVYEEGDYDDSPAEDDLAVYEEGDYDDSPAEDDEYVVSSDEELAGDEEYDEDNMDSDR